MRQNMHARYVRAVFGAAVAAVFLAMSAFVVVGAAAQPAAQEPAPAPGTPRVTAPLDLEGYWVSVVTEDWRWRMMTPAKGDAPGVPLSLEGRTMADSWDLERDNAAGRQCMTYGAGGIMRIPGRIHISWQDDYTLRLDFDAGEQTRLIHLPRDRGSPPPGQSPTPQGYSLGSWELRRDAGLPTNGEGAPPGGRGPAAATPEEPGSLKVVTTALSPGYFRKNGLYYGENATLTEYFNRHDDFGDEWFTVLSVLEDPRYLISPFVTTTHFKREPDGSGWSPQPCETLPPTAPRSSGGQI